MGGEFKLIDLISKNTSNPDVIVGIGDDCAVLKYSEKEHLLWTVDMMVDGDHFRTDWMTGGQVGAKTVESNVSDIAAMGGLPKYALVSIALTDDTPIEFVEELYGGMRLCGKKYGLEIVGGNTTHSKTLTIDFTLLGVVEEKKLTLRSGARVGDLICVTGDLGKSRVGLELLLAGKTGFTDAYLNPSCRLFEAREIAGYANSMIDVSDGLASEVNHICQMSGVGAKVYEKEIPILEKTRKAAESLGKNPLEYALHGGEDYELVFTVSAEKYGKMNVECPTSVVGKILPESSGTNLIDPKGVKKPLGGGYDHFKTDM